MILSEIIFHSVSEYNKPWERLRPKKFNKQDFQVIQAE